MSLYQEILSSCKTYRNTSKQVSNKLTQSGNSNLQVDSLAQEFVLPFSVFGKTNKSLILNNTIKQLNGFCMELVSEGSTQQYINIQILVQSIYTGIQPSLTSLSKLTSSGQALAKTCIDNYLLSMLLWHVWDINRENPACYRLSLVKML